MAGCRWPGSGSFLLLPMCPSSVQLIFLACPVHGGPVPQLLALVSSGVFLGSSCCWFGSWKCFRLAAGSCVLTCVVFRFSPDGQSCVSLSVSFFPLGFALLLLPRSTVYRIDLLFLLLIADGFGFALAGFPAGR